MLAIFTALILSTLAPQAQTVEPANNVQACKWEDGSGQRHCVWDARHMGNGGGRSFIALDGGTDRAVYVYISHKRAHRLSH